MEDCIFCKIIKGEIPSTKVYEDDTVLAFLDVSPQAPVHVLVVPKTHVANITELEDPSVMEKMLHAVNVIVEEQKIKERGFRLVINTGKEGQQSVNHLHIHILGGRQLEWPPG